MITANDKLEIFENFRVDWDLPKHKRKEEEEAKAFALARKMSQAMNEDSDEDSIEDSDGGSVRFSPPMRFGPAVMVSSSATSSNMVVNWSEATGVQVQASSPKASVKQPWTSRLAFWRKPPTVALAPEPEPALSVEEFFRHVKNNVQELKVIEARAAGYERAMKNAKTAGQHALFEQLAAGLNAFRMETQLVAMEMPKFLTEETLVAFYKQSKKGLRLDWVRNFARVIPENVVAKKARADEVGIFDNYVVLHYDPQAKAYAETEKEKQAKRDPILFGVMQGRRVLYVVGDWIDEVCDLTLDQIAEQLGGTAVGSFTDPIHPYRT